MFEKFLIISVSGIGSSSLRLRKVCGRFMHFSGHFIVHAKAGMKMVVFAVFLKRIRQFEKKLM